MGTTDRLVGVERLRKKKSRRRSLMLILSSLQIALMYLPAWVFHGGHFIAFAILQTWMLQPCIAR
jgi:hypothetical protein